MMAGSLAPGQKTGVSSAKQFTCLRCHCTAGVKLLPTEKKNEESRQCKSCSLSWRRSFTCANSEQKPLVLFDWLLQIIHRWWRMRKNHKHLKALPK
jgi:hypothetical protein